MYDAKQIKSRVNIQDFAVSVLALPLVGEPGRDRQLTAPCPKCGGIDRFNVFVDGWFCRQCKPLVKGRNHDCFDLAMHANKATTFAQAVALVGDWLNDPSTVTAITERTAERTAERTTKVDWRSEDWQQAAERDARHSDLLLMKTGGKPGRDYLDKRGLTLETCERWGVGYGDGWSKADKATRRGVKFVWRDESHITGIQTRFLEPDSNGKRYSRFVYPHNSTGSAGMMTLYYLIEGESDILFIVEGEINALSIWQAIGCHVVSFGSESITLDAKNEAATLAARYKKVVIWADKGVIGRELAAMTPGAKAIKSPRGMDANDLLVSGDLQQFLHTVVGRLFGDTLPLVSETTTDPLETMMTDPAQWERQRDARWVWRWRNGYTDYADAHARRNVETAAKRLGVNL